MNLENKPRWIMVLAAAGLIIAGLAIWLSSNENLSSGSISSPVPSLGYDRNLSFVEIGSLGIMMITVGVILAFISVGIRKWPRYQPKEQYIDGIKAVTISVATTDYVKDREALQQIMRSAELAVHSKNEFIMDDEPDSKMGWQFFVLHVSPNLVNKINDYYLDNELQHLKVDEKFIRWLSAKMEEKQSNAHLDFEWKKGSSKYGLF